ncbi:hypothetical protein D3C71_2010470 [compost metagenome]
MRRCGSVASKRCRLAKRLLGVRGRYIGLPRVSSCSLNASKLASTLNVLSNRFSTRSNHSSAPPTTDAGSASGSSSIATVSGK